MKKSRVLSMVLVAALLTVPLAGCGNTSGGSGDEIVIGGLAPLTGSVAQYGVAVDNAVKMAVDDINAKGGLLGKRIKYISYDEKGDPTEATNAYTRLVDQDKIVALIGDVTSAPCEAVAQQAARDKLPMITPSGTSEAITTYGENVFRACFIDPYQGEKMANYAVEKLSAKTAAVFYQTGNDYSEGLMNAFVAKAAELGLEIVDTEAFAEGDKDFKAQMTNIAAADPDVVFAPIYYAEAGLAITAARAAGCDAVFMGGDGFGSVKNYASAEDLEGSVYCSGYAPGTDSVKQFEEDYKAAYNVDEIPNMFAPLAYDAAMLLCEGLKAAEEQGLTAGTEEYKQAVIDAIKNMNGTEGITGSYSFDEYNNPIKPVAIIELTGGDEVYQEMY